MGVKTINVLGIQVDVFLEHVIDGVVYYVIKEDNDTYYAVYFKGNLIEYTYSWPIELMSMVILKTNEKIEKPGKWAVRAIIDGRYTINDRSYHWAEIPYEFNIRSSFGGWQFIYNGRETEWVDQKYGIDFNGCLRTDLSSWVKPIVPSFIRLWVEE